MAILSLHQEQLWVREYLVDFDAAQASERVGVKRSSAYFGRAMLKRPRVIAFIHAEMDARRVRLQLSGDHIVTGLLAGLNRLMAMVGQDEAELYDQQGKLRPVAEWPDVWRKGLVRKVDTQVKYERSRDGGDQSWDPSAVVTKIERESELAIHAKILEYLVELRQHTDWVPKRQGVDISVTINAEIDKRISEGRERARIAAELTPEREDA